MVDMEIRVPLLLETPALIPTIWKEYKDYYRRDFHPWEHDNRELLEGWEAEHDNYKAV